MFKEKNILYIVHSFNSFTKDQIEELSQYFKEVTVFVRYKPIAELARFIPFLSNYIYHSKKFAIDLKDCPQNVRIIATPIFYLPGEFFYKRIAERLLKKTLKQIYKYKVQFDLVHAHFAWTSGYVAQGISKVFQKPFVITLHGEDSYDLPFRDDEWRRKISNVMNAASHLICVGNKIVKAIQQMEIKTPYTVIGNGFNPSYFYPMDKNIARRNIGLGTDSPLILSIGSLDQIKGHIYLIRALSILKEKQVSFQSLIIGSGPEYKSLHTEIESLGLAEYVRIEKNIPHHVLVNYFNAADVFCLPSLHESFGVVQLEAWACGIPVVATRNGGSDYLFSDEDGVGLLCQVGDNINLADTIVAGLKIEWNKKNILKFAQKFTISTVSEKVLHTYKKILI
jgi:glycosyltransferase involved in cell wall biosynthesis